MIERAFPSRCARLYRRSRIEVGLGSVRRSVVLSRRRIPHERFFPPRMLLPITKEYPRCPRRDESYPESIEMINRAQNRQESFDRFLNSPRIGMSRNLPLFVEDDLGVNLEMDGREDGGDGAGFESVEDVGDGPGGRRGGLIRGAWRLGEREGRRGDGGVAGMGGVEGGGLGMLRLGGKKGKECAVQRVTATRRVSLYATSTVRRCSLHDDESIPV